MGWSLQDWAALDEDEQVQWRAWDDYRRLLADQLTTAFADKEYAYTPEVATLIFFSSHGL